MNHRINQSSLYQLNLAGEEIPGQLRRACRQYQGSTISVPTIPASV
jgi:hypothetical protein